MGNADARRLALESSESLSMEPTSVIGYRSNGRLLAIGDAASLERCDELPAGIALSRLVMPADGVEVEGYLGSFKLRSADAAGQPIGHQADAILDMNREPLLAREMLPPGYFHWPPGAELNDELRADLQDLAGEFEKPKYFVYDESICAHGVHGQTVCTHCIDACPAEAIVSIGDRIEVDPHLCQGGGACATVCPSGAIRYLYPTLRDQGRRMRTLLQTYRDQGGESPRLIFHSENFDPASLLDSHHELLPMAVEELASVGPDLWLSALAGGARQVVLLVDREVPASAVENLRRQLGWISPLLTAIGLDTNCVSCCDQGEPVTIIDSGPEIEPSMLDVPPGKRDAMLRAVDHLVAQLKPAESPIELPSPAPFGEALIDADKCTLCMACVGACPGRALQDGSNREIPEVLFIESNCLQCGACVMTCPEDAIAIRPRLLLDAEKRRQSRSLNQDQPFACIGCGKLFAPTSVVRKMQDKLKDHHMFSNQRALDRLKMCDDCRVADIVQDPEAMGGQFDPGKGFRQ